MESLDPRRLLTADLVVSVDGPEQALPGDELSFVVRIENLGPDASPDVQIEQSGNELDMEWVRTNLFPAEMDATFLDGSNGFSISGFYPELFLGQSISMGGDVNNDGYADVIVEASNNYYEYEHETDEIHVIFGGAEFQPELDVQELHGDNGFSMLSQGFPGAGVREAGDGSDYNADGYDDYLIEWHPTLDDGEVLLLFGGPSGIQSGDAEELSDGELEVSGIGASDFGVRIFDSQTARSYMAQPGGDLNGDDVDDFLIASNLVESDESGGGWVLFGGDANFSEDIDLSNLPANRGYRISGVDFDPPNFVFLKPEGLSGIGDINGDGIGDFAVSDFTQDAAIVFGSSDVRTELDASNLAASDGLAISGTAELMWIDAAGDVNGDGVEDFLVEQPHATTSYVIFGSATGFPSSLDLSALTPGQGLAIQHDVPGRIPTGPREFALEAVGDVNADGIDDIIVGASYHWSDAYSAGRAFVVFGTDAIHDAPIDVLNLDGTNGFSLYGRPYPCTEDLPGGCGSGDGYGATVAGGADVNGDGIDDMIIGGPFSGAEIGAESGAYSGAVDVIFGRATELQGTGLIADAARLLSSESVEYRVTVTVPLDAPNELEFVFSASSTTDEVPENNTAQLNVAIATPGDANIDGTVDFEDFLILSRNFAKNADAVWAEGDFNRDGSVSFADFLLLSANFVADNE